MLEEVCVQGMGYVGIATATVIASARDITGNLLYNVTGIDLNDKNGLEKINHINEGNLYFPCDDINFKEKSDFHTRSLKNRDFNIHSFYTIFISYFSTIY